jgi:hypothetical protein
VKSRENTNCILCVTSISISVSFIHQKFIREYSYSFSLLSHDVNAKSAEQLALLRVNTTVKTRVVRVSIFSGI